MEERVRTAEATALVRDIHAAPGRICLVTTGVGALATYWLFSQPGASRTMLDAQIPYSGAALEAYVGETLGQHVSVETAVQMARAARARARSLASRSELPAQTRLIGVACTGAIATDRVRRGEERLHAAWTDGSRTRSYSLVFRKGARDRGEEEEIGSAIVLNAVAESKGLTGRIELSLAAGEAVVESD